MYSATVHKHTFSSQFCQFLPRHGLQQQILLRTRSFPLMWIQIDFSNLNFLPLSCAECLVDFADSWKLIHFLLSVNEGLHTFSGEQVVFPWEYFSHWERGILVFTSWWSSHQGIWIGRSAWIVTTVAAWLHFINSYQILKMQKSCLKIQKNPQMWVLASGHLPTGRN